VPPPPARPHPPHSHRRISRSPLVPRMGGPPSAASAVAGAAMAKAGAAGVVLPAAAVFPATTVPAAAARRPLLSAPVLPLRQEGQAGPASRTPGPGPFICIPDPGVPLPHTLLDRPSSLRLFLLASLASGPASGAFQRQHQAPLPTPRRPSTTMLAGINRL